MLKSSMSSTRTEKTDSLNSSGMYHKYQHDLHVSRRVEMGNCVPVCIISINMICMSPEELKWETVF